MEIQKHYLSPNSNLKLIKPKNNEQQNKNKRVVSTKKNNNINKINIITKNINLKKKNFNNFFSTKNILYSKKDLKILSKSKEKSKDNYNDTKILNRDLNKIILEINNINDLLKVNVQNLDKLKLVLNNLKIIKKNKKLELKNYLSDKETLDEKLKYLITEINIKNNNNNGSSLNLEDNFYINITLKDFKYVNKDKFIKKIIDIFGELNINNINPDFNIFINKIISKKIFNLFNNNNNYDKTLIDNFFIEISNDIILYLNIYHLSEIIINYLLRILIKINVISENIEFLYNYLEKKYKKEKNEIKEKINIFEKENLDLKSRKIELEKLRKYIERKKNLLSKKKSPYCEKTICYHNCNKKELLLNNKMNSIICIKPEYLNLTNFDINKNNMKIINQKQSLIKYLTNYSKENANNKKSDTNHSKIISKSEMLNIEIESPFSSGNKNKFEAKIENKDNIPKNIINNKTIEMKYIFKNKNYKLIVNDNDNGKNTKNQKIAKKIRKTNTKYNFTNLFHLISNHSFKKLNNSKNKKKENTLLNNNLLKKTPRTFVKPKNISIFTACSDNIQKKKICKIKNQIYELSLKQFNEKQKTLENKFNDNNIESFCYYKFLEDDYKPFNPLNNKINFNKLGYNEGFISLDNFKKIIKIKSKKIAQNKYDNNENKINLDYINNKYNTLYLSDSSNSIFSKKTNNLNNINYIELKDIENIYLNKIMENIIKIHIIFLKNIKTINNSNDGILNNININKLLNKREIINIKGLEQNEKIKAGLCNFFSFIIQFNNSQKIEFILINFVHFNVWFKFLEKEVNNNNIKSKKLVKTEKDKNIKKFKSFIIKKEIKKKNMILLIDVIQIKK